MKGFLKNTVLIALIAFAAVLGGCAKDGTPSDAGDGAVFYTLQKSYDLGYLSQNDLKSIAYYVNNGKSFSVLTDGDIVQTIKESVAKSLRERKIEPVAEAKAEDITIVEYYGKYSDGYAVRVRNSYDIFPTDIPDIRIQIGGVEFHFTSYDTFGVVMK